MLIRVMVPFDVTEELAKALMNWQDTPYRGCNDYLAIGLTDTGMSMLNLGFIRQSAIGNGYCMSDLGLKVRKELEDMARG